MTQFIVRADYARRMPDPTFKANGVDRHILFVRVPAFPPGLEERLDPNARRPDTDRRVYKEVKSSLESNDGLFHLKNKGITLVARRVEKLEEDEYALVLEENDGILDGGHTAHLIAEANRTLGRSLANQYVKMEVLTSLEPTLISDIAGGLNTSVQVQLMSLQNNRGGFNWLKALSDGKPYASRIAWSENDEGDVDARELIAILSMFDIASYPADPDATQPVTAYSSKEATLKRYVEDPTGIQRLSPIVGDILELYDHIALHSRSLWNDGRGRFGALKWVRQGTRVLPFINETVDAVPLPSALLPLVACFRQFITERDGGLGWDRPFAQIKAEWLEQGLTLLRMTDDACNAAAHNPNKMGKSSAHWSGLLTRSMWNAQNRSDIGVR